MKTAVRLDDITPDMDYQKFYKMKAILDQYQIKPLIGVVPFNQDKMLMQEPIHLDFGKFLQKLQADGWVIALHGYQHLYGNHKGGLFPLNHDSEFAGVILEKQKEMMKDGLKQLQRWGVQTDIFMAPSHSYDQNTLTAMKAVGLNKMTDGFGKRPYIRDGITFYPIAKRRQDCMSQKEGYTTLVFHTNTMDEAEFQDTEDLFSKCRGQLISYDDYLLVKAENRNCFGIMKEYVLASVKRILVKGIAKLHRKG